MPTYLYRCPDGHEFDVIKSVKIIDREEVCECGKVAQRRIVPTMLNCDMQVWDRYVSPASGKLITSYKERREDMARTGCVDYDPGMKTDYQNNIKRSDAKLEKSVGETVEKEIEKMSSHKRERLHNEMVGGADIEFVRK